VYSSCYQQLCLTATGKSHAVGLWDHKVLPATRQRWDSRSPALTPSRSRYSI